MENIAEDLTAFPLVRLQIVIGDLPQSDAKKGALSFPLVRLQIVIGDQPQFVDLRGKPIPFPLVRLQIVIGDTGR
jgi:hypothetical protein